MTLRLVFMRSNKNNAIVAMDTISQRFVQWRYKPLYFLWGICLKWFFMHQSVKSRSRRSSKIIIWKTLF